MHLARSIARRRSVPLLLAVLVLLASGCSSSRSTRPVVPRGTPRDVALVATDSLGAALPDLLVRATSLTDSAGLARVQVAVADAQGVARFALLPGPWAFTASLGGVPERVLGASAIVPGDERPEGDSVRVDATAHTASTVSGRVRLRGSVDHAGTLVGLGVAAAYTVTDANGDFALGGVPVGAWAVTAWHGGYRLGVWRVDVPAPGSALVVPEDSLATSDDLPEGPPTHSAARPVGTSPPWSFFR